MRGLLVLVVFLSGCASVVTPRRYPSTDPRGMPAVIFSVKGERIVADELLAVDSQTLWIIKEGKTYSMPSKEVSSVVVPVYDRGNVSIFWLVFTPLMMLGSILHGLLLILTVPAEFLVGSIGCGLDNAFFRYQKVRVKDLKKNFKKLRAYCRYPQGMPTYFYVKGDSLYVYTPVEGELKYEVYSEEGYKIAGGYKEASRGLNVYPLIEKGRVKVYLNGHPVMAVKGLTSSREMEGEGETYNVTVQGDSLIITVDSGQVRARYFILSPDGTLLDEKDLGTLQEGKHTYRLNLKTGTYILKVRVNDDVRKFKINVEEEE